MTSPAACTPQKKQVDSPAPQELGQRPRAARRSGLVNFAPEILVALVFLAVQANGVLHMGYAGQDFDIHMRWMQEASADPWGFLTQYQSQVMGRTNPPLYHLLAATAAAWGPFSVERNVGALNLIIGLSGLLLFMATARVWITSVAVRTSLYLFLALLPVFCIQSLVMAADVLTLPAGGLLLLGISKMLVARGRAAASGIALIAGGLALGVLSKFTFLAAPWLVLALASLLFHRRLLSRRWAIGLALLGAGAPLLLGAGLWWRFHSTIDNHFGRAASWLETKFSPSDLLLLKSKDRELWEAVPYARRLDVRTLKEEQAPYPEASNQPGPDHAFVLLQQHRYSYQALLVNALFTDIMNVRQPGRTGLYFGPRSLSHQTRMNLAIRSGWFLYFCMLLLAGWALVGSVRGLWVTADARSIFVLTSLTLSLLFIGPVLFSLLFVFDGYAGGYWLPRLILFPLAGGLLACFVWADQLNRRFSRRLGWPLLAIALWQSLLSLSFLVC